MKLRIEIPKRGFACKVCSLAFAAGSTLVSRLCFGDKGVVLRFDECMNCAQTPCDSDFSYWKTVMPLEKKTAKQKTSTAKELFETLFKSSDQPSKLYLLALYLERRRQLIRRDALKEEGREIILFESLSSGEIYPIYNVAMDEIFQDVPEELSNIL